MTTITILVAADPIVTWAEAKAHLRLDKDDEQDYVEALIAAATAYVDGPTSYTGRAIAMQVVEERFDEFDDPLVLGLRPVIEIEGEYGDDDDPLGVFYLDADGSEQSVEITVYGVLGDAVYLRTDQGWPTILGDPGSAIVRYRTGYETVPAAIKQAILLLVGGWYRTRESVVVGQTPAEVPLAVNSLLAPYRVWV